MGQVGIRCDSRAVTEFVGFRIGDGVVVVPGALGARLAKSTIARSGRQAGLEQEVSMGTHAVVFADAGPNFSAYVPDLPGCVAVGITVEEVTAYVRNAIELYVAGSIEFGDEVPRPSSQVVVVEVAT